MNRASLASLSLVFAFACTSPSTGDDEAADATDGTDTAGTDSTGTDDTSDATTTTDTGSEPLATVSGFVVDMQGAVLPSPGVQLCGPVNAMGDVESCLPVVVDKTTGAFTIGATKLGTYALKCVHGPADGRYFTGQSFQISLAEGDMLDLSSPPIVIPETAGVTDLSGAMGPTDIVIDDVLRLNLDPSLAQSPDFTAPTEIGGLEVDPEFWRVSEVEGAPVIAAWSFTPFGTHSTADSFEFSLASSFGLATGEGVKIYAIEKDNGVIHPVATGTVNADASGIDLVTGEGLHQLSWLLVTQ